MTENPTRESGAEGGDDPGGASRYLDTEAVYAAVAERLGKPGFWALSPHEAGLGNETLFLMWDSRRFVVRRPPLDGAPAGAHDVLREFRALERLEWADVPTPRPVLAVEDPSVAGAPFTVLERLDGKVLRHGEPMAYVEGDSRARVGEALVDTLAAIHDTDTGDADLHDSRSLSAHVDRFRDLFADHHAGIERPVPGLDRVGEWLAGNVPAERDRTVVHGDYTLANVKFTAEAPEVVGVLDWERAGIGDPLTDLGRLVAFWFESEDEACGLPFEIAPRFTTREGYHGRAQLVERYEGATGRRFGADRFYRALALFETAAVCEGYYRRHVEGRSDRPAFATLDEAVPALVDRAAGIIDGEEPL
jgi:aminoglycoside phosphotransferase (APT) family kinase protein